MSDNPPTNEQERVELLTREIGKLEIQVFSLRLDLAKAEGELEGMYRLREQLGEPALSHKHTLRGRTLKYLAEHPASRCTDMAKSLGVPVTTMSMCLNRNKELFCKNANGDWLNIHYVHNPEGHHPAAPQPPA